MLPALVLKDYWVTRVLAVIAADSELRERAIFKGGTSLSKGWGLIDRFSEDIDILLTGPAFGPPPESRGEREHVLKHLHSSVQSQTGLLLPTPTSVDQEVCKFYYARDDWHSRVRYPLPGKKVLLNSATWDWVLVEAGFRGGPNPHSRRPLRSIVADYLHTRGLISQLAEYSEDLAFFELELFRPERTFAEKFLLLHVAMSDGDAGANRVPIRHYSDLVQLFIGSSDVQALLGSRGFLSLVQEAAQVSNKYFGTSIDVERLDLRASPALNPTTGQSATLRTKYENPLERVLYHKGRMPFDEMVGHLARLREMILKV
jgi:hypothetical protein